MCINTKVTPIPLLGVPALGVVLPPQPSPSLPRGVVTTTATQRQSTTLLSNMILHINKTLPTYKILFTRILIPRPTLQVQRTPLFLVHPTKALLCVFTLAALLSPSSALPIFNATTETLTIPMKLRMHTSATTRDAPALASLSVVVITTATTCASTIVKTSRSAASPSTKNGSTIETTLAAGGDAHDASSASISPRMASNAPSARGRVSPSARRSAAADLEVGEQRHSLAHATNQPGDTTKSRTWLKS